MYYTPVCCDLMSFGVEIQIRERTTNAFTQVALSYCASAFPVVVVAAAAVVVGHFPCPTALNYYS